MDKKTYLEKYTKLSQPGQDVEEVKKATRQLENYLKKTALQHIKATTGRDIVKESTNFGRVEFNLSTAPSGNVIIVFSDSTNWRIAEREVFKVPKSELFK